LNQELIHITTRLRVLPVLVAVGTMLFKKAYSSVVSNQIGMKSGRIFFK